MEIYWFALLITILLAWALTSKYVSLGNGCVGKITYFRVWIAFLPLFLLALFRWNVGVDVVYGTGYYYIEYTAIQAGMGNILGYEPGFYWLMKLCNLLHLNLYLFYCVITIIFFLLFLKYIKNNTDNITLAAIIFFISDMYLFTFSTLRQAIGMAFFLYPMAEMINRNKYWKNWKWWICAILAISMHISIIYLVLVLVISRVKFRKRTLLYITGLGCLLSPLINIILTRIMSYTYYFGKYFGSNEYRTEFTPTYFFIALVLFVPLLLFYKKFTERKNNYILVNVSAFVVILMLNSQALVMPYRIFPLFIPIFIVLITRLVSSLTNKKSIRLIAELYCIAPFVFLFINQYYLNGSSLLFKYKSIFQYFNQIW